MTVKKSYTCNVCGLDIRHEEHGYGIHFSSGRIDLKSRAECENHLCTDCGDQLVSAFNRAEAESVTRHESPKP